MFLHEKRLPTRAWNASSYAMDKLTVKHSFDVAWRILQCSPRGQLGVYTLYLTRASPNLVHRFAHRFVHRFVHHSSFRRFWYCWTFRGSFILKNKTKQNKTKQNKIMNRQQSVYIQTSFRIVCCVVRLCK